MAFFAQHGVTSVCQDDFAAQREIDSLVRQIDEQQSVIKGSLGVWLRCRQWAEKNNSRMPDSADQAMERIIQARKAENALFRQLFGISDELKAIEKR